MNFSQFIVLILIFYGIYYSIIVLIDFFRNDGKAIAGAAGNSPHAVSFEVKQQPVNVAALVKTDEQYQKRDSRENYFIKEQATKAIQKNNSTIVADLGLEILPNGIDISAENLAILLS
jgi:hypothetical protein